MTQKRYLSVEQALQNHDYDLLRSLGRLGGIRNGERRRREAESRKRIAQLEAGTIEPRAKKRASKKPPPVQTQPSEEELRIEAILEADWQQQLLRDARRHQMRNLAGASQQ